MKKVLLLFAIAVAMTANASDLVTGTKDLKLGKKVYSLILQKPMLAASTASDKSDIVGTYVGSGVTEDPVNSASAVTIAAGDGNYIVTGAFLGTPNAAVKATFADGKLTIPMGQQVYNHKTYGPASLFGTNTNNDLVDLVFTLEEDGTLSMDPTITVSMILTTGTYQGYSLGDEFTSYAFNPANGTITFDAYTHDGNPKDPATETYSSCVKVKMDEQGNVVSGTVYGFDNMTWLPFTVTSGNNIKFSSDKVYYYNNNYGLAIATDFNELGQFDPKEGPTGTIDIQAGTIKMPSWAFMLPSADGTKFYGLNSVKKNCVITFTRSTSVNNVNDDVVLNKTTKVIENGKLVITKNGVKYNVAGQIVK